MSDILHPPLRILTSSSVTLTSDAAKAHLDAFLAEYEDRTAKGGNSAVTSQLRKLRSALVEKHGGHSDKEERVALLGTDSIQSARSRGGT